ncbi:uncharacterized protein LOC136087151 [Hydra vulgaris]|uniref:Uncharacterized protein LOC136087151 n=1 Tax=Hydra vulgaris TaxID=6087 RepID=A0ABM4CUV2_HYDVU
MLENLNNYKTFSKNSSVNNKKQPFINSINNNNNFLNDNHSLKLKCLYTNSTSLNKEKLLELSDIALSTSIDIIFITETWFNEISSPSIKNYDLFRHDRNNHAGVAIYSRTCLNVIELSLSQIHSCFTFKHSEQLWLSLPISKRNKLLINCIYRPPKMMEKTAKEINNCITLAKKSIDGNRFLGLLLTGNFNYPNIVWNDDYSTNFKGPSKPIEANFINTLNISFLYQCIHSPTFILNKDKCINTLDLVITDSPNKISKIAFDPPLGCATQGHLLLNWNLIIERSNYSTPFIFSKLCYKKRNTKWKVPYLVNLSNTVRNQIKKYTRSAIRIFEEDLANDKRNPKRLFNYINSKCSSSSPINALITESDFSVKKVGIANELNLQFQSVFTTGNVHTLPHFPNRTSNTISSLKIDQSLVKSHLLKLDLNKSFGTDCSWLEANVTPLYKKSCKTDPANCRPVSLTSVTCKILEKIIRDKITEHLSHNNLISTCQHGFVTSKSSLTNLLETMDFITFAKSNKKLTDVIFLDYAKAFDKVPHKPLLFKLEKYGIVGKLFSWINSFLSNSRQRVVLGETISDYVPVTSSVPQGSLVGPTLFIIYVNDLPDKINNVCKMYANYTKILATIKSKKKAMNDCRVILIGLQNGQECG